MRVTLRDVADKAGVTASIVSRVLNGKPEVRVAEETRARILKAARDLNYRPNPQAQALQSGKSPAIIFVSPLQFFVMNARKAMRLQTAMRSVGRPILSVNLRNFGEPEAAVDFLLSSRPAAVVWLSPTWDDRDFREACVKLHDHDIYVLAADHQSTLPLDVPCDVVGVDRTHGCYRAVSHLIDRVGENVALLANDLGGRVEGYRQALGERGIQRKIIGWLTGEEPPHEARRVTLKLLRDHPEIDGLFCHSDLNAIGAISAIRELGLRIPEDVAVAGFDNESWTEFHDPPLTTVAHPIEQLCSQTVSVLRSRLDGNTEPWRRIALQPTLIVRASTDDTR